jgi:hypothetical protein
MRRAAAILAALAAVGAVLAAPNAQGQMPAGTTEAVLSYVDAAGGHVSVVRHWHGPGTGQDTQVYPDTPYFWDGCLPFQNGALMFLVTSPVGYQPPGLVGSEEYTSRFLAGLGQALSSAVSAGASQVPADQQDARRNLQAVAIGLTTPGDPAYEAMKAVVGQVNSLDAYEKYGYAVFMFIRWRWVYIPFPVPVPCSQIDFRTVPEGYAIPFVARRGPGAAGPVQARWPR